jgi:hypothetical protein
VPCEFPVLQCFEWHVKPKLLNVKTGSDPESVRALCPAHDDSTHSLGVSVKDRQRIVWNCFACDNNPRVRLALIRVCGIDPGCLRLPRAEREDMLDRLERILTAATDRHADKVLHAMAALEGYQDLPKGAELERIARLADVSRAGAFNARKRPLGSTDNTCSYAPAEKPVKPGRSRGRAA